MVTPQKLAALGTVLLAWSAWGQAVPRLDALSPSWFQRGTTNEITLSGEALGQLTEVLFSGSGIRAHLLERPTPPVTLESSGVGLTAVAVDLVKNRSIRLEISPDAALGSRELRVAGPSGVSNPQTLQLSDVPELKEGKPGEATPLTLPAGVSGVISASTESDSFRFPARAGQKLTFDVQANRMGSPLDPTLILLNAQGQEVARSEDAHGLDPFLEFTVPADGEYVAKVQDLRFQGGGDYRYRILAGELPYLEYLFPFGGRRGTTVPVQLSGYQLAGADTMNVQIATDAPLGRQEIRARTARGLSNPQPFEAGDLPEFLEVEPNSATNTANRVSVPVVINGRIGETNDVDFFRLTVPTDQKVVLDVQARRFGSPLDALLTLQDAQGNVLQRNDDSGGPDARLEFDAKKDTEYLVSLRDLTDRGGSRLGYRLTAQAPNLAPNFAVKSPAGRIRVHQGGRWAIRCNLERHNGFDGLVRIEGGNLPAGVTAAPLVLGPGNSFGWLVLTAAENAPLGYSPLQLIAVGERQGQAVSHPVQFAEAAWLTILPATPVTVDVGPWSLLTEQNSSTTLEVSVLRRVGFSGEVRVLAEDLPGVSIPAVTLAPGQSRAKLVLNLANGAEVGIRPVMVRAEAIAEARTNVSYATQAVPLQTQGIAMFLTAMLPGSPFFRTDGFRLSAVALPTNSTSSANQTEFVVKVDRRGLPGEIALVLEDLPKGVVATVNPIAADKNEASIKLLVSDQAETGKELRFFAVGSATHQDRIWRQKTQPITLFIAAPEKETAATSPASTPAPPGAK